MRNTHRALADFAEGPQSTDSPLYGAMTRAIMNSEALTRLVERTPQNQPLPLHLLAAMQFLIRRTPEHALTGFYVNPEQERSLDDLQQAMEDFATSHQTEIEHLLTTRIVQTNETGRAVALAPGFCLIYQRTGLPLATVEIGAAAGLLLGWSDFFYDYGEAGTLGNPSSLVKLRTDALGHRTLPLSTELPPHGERIGIDRWPLDVSDPDDADWLRALVWPEHRERLERLNAAIETVAFDPPYIMKADAPDGLGSLLMQIDDRMTRVVFHSIALYQSDRETWTRIDEALIAASRTRPVYRLGLEFDAGQKGIDQPFLTLSVYASGGVNRQVLARVQYHGRWIEWLAD